jgi:hypothetical protein
MNSEQAMNHFLIRRIICKRPTPLCVAQAKTETDKFAIKPTPDCNLYSN